MSQDYILQKDERRMEINRMIDCLDPPENPEVAYFSSSLALNLFLFLSSLPPFNLCIIFATKLTSICLCLSHFVSVFVHLLLSYRIFSNIKSLFFIFRLCFTLSVSLCVSACLCRAAPSFTLYSIDDVIQGRLACYPRLKTHHQPSEHVLKHNLSLTQTHAHTWITR